MRDFEEHQQFRQWWLLALLALVVLSGLVPLVLLLITGDGSGDPVWLMILVAAFTILLPAWVVWVRLETNVDAEALHIRYRGLFVRRRIAYTDIEHSEAVTYRPIKEYGGWGLRWRGKGKIAYSVSGKQGVRFHLSDGREVLVGSQMAEELVATMKAWERR